MRLHTPLTRLLGIDVPIVQAPIGGQGSPELAAAVSNAGGLGCLALSWAKVDQARTSIRQTQHLTKRPFMVNLVLAFPQEERIALCVESGVPVISFSWGDPTPYLDDLHRAGAIVALSVASAAEAQRAVEMGVDVIVAQGWEAGGHVLGQVATLPLVPAVVDAVPADVPVVAAGGIADGRGLAAVLALGAAGAWMGTRFVMAQEALGHRTYHELMVAAAETDTFYSELFDVGWPNAPHRTLRNSTVETWLEAGSPPPGRRPGENQSIATTADGTEVLRYSSEAPLNTLDGDIEALSLWAGQSVGLIHDVRPAADIVRDIADEAAAVLRKLGD